MDLSHYDFDALQSDDDIVLSRGRERTSATSHRRSILVKTARSEPPRPGTVRAMEHEFSLRAELDSTWAIRPLELTQYKGRTILILEDPGGEPLDRLTHGIGKVPSRGDRCFCRPQAAPHSRPRPQRCQAGQHYD